MINSPRISIITACYNSASTLRTMLESIRVQGGVHGFSKELIECIVIDGGSHDGTQDILREFDDVITFWSSEKDRGIADAFSKGIAQAHGEWIAILGADDAYLPNAFDTILSGAKQFPDADILYGEALLEQPGNQTVVQRAVPFSELNLYHSFICHQAVFARKRVFDAIGSFREQLHYAMDYDWLLRAWKQGFVFQPLPDAKLVRYSLVGASGKHRLKALREMREIAVSVGLDPAESQRQFRLSVIKSSIESIMQTMGLQPMVHLYRTRIKKRYASVQE